MPPPAPRDRFLQLLREAAAAGTLVKLTLGKYRGPEASLRNLHVRPVELKGGPRLAFTWRHAHRDITKNHPVPEALDLLAPLLGDTFRDAHLFTTTATAQLETRDDGTGRIRLRPAAGAGPAAAAPAVHDRPKRHALAATLPWLCTLGVTNERGQPREGMADKFRQIQRFAEIFSHLLADAGLAPPAGRGEAPPLRIVDMGSGKGYLTFALATLLGPRAQVLGIEARPDLVALCNQAAAAHGLSTHLTFATGTIADTPLPHGCDVLLALHACDTATDDALARGLAAGARLLLVAPCCHQELRPQFVAPPVLAGALRHGIFQERQAEFVTDALRALLLEWSGCRTKVFEFISTEHTAKNLMIAAVRPPAGPAGRPRVSAAPIRELAAFYGIRTQALARHLAFPLAGDTPAPEMPSAAADTGGDLRPPAPGRKGAGS